MSGTDEHRPDHARPLRPARGPEPAAGQRTAPGVTASPSRVAEPGGRSALPALSFHQTATNPSHMNSPRHFSHLAAALYLFASTARCDETYSATATLEVRPEAAGKLTTLRGLLPKDDPSVTIQQVRDVSLFDLSVTSPTPQQAADRANEIARKIQATLKQSGIDVIIWERAVPPKAPSTPKPK